MSGGAADYTDEFMERLAVLREEHGGGRGWKGHAARRLGIQRSYLSRILSGEKRVGAALAVRVGLLPDRASISQREADVIASLVPLSTPELRRVHAWLTAALEGA